MSDADFLQGLREAEDRAERMRAAREAAADGPSALLNHRVRIEGLTGRADLNGRHGLARTFVADKGRYAVQSRRGGRGSAGSRRRRRPSLSTSC